MDMDYGDDLDYYEPCMCCGEFGHWAQDCPTNSRMNQNVQRCNQQWVGPEYQSHQQVYNHGHYPRGSHGQRNYQDDCQKQSGQLELDDIRTAIKQLTSLVEAVMHQQERQAKDHQTLVGHTTQLAAYLSEVISVIRDSGKSSHVIKSDPIPQFSNSQNTNSAHINPLSFQTSSEVSIVEQTSPPMVERVVESSENVHDQDLSLQNKLESEYVKKSLNVPFPSALIGEVSIKQKHDPTQDERWENFQKRKINLPFLNIIKENPDNVECLKGLTTQKRRHKFPDKVELSAGVCAVLLGTCPRELQDPGAPGISVQLGEFKVDKALLDLGLRVNILPESLYDQYDFGPLQRVQTTVLLADQTFTRPRGIVKDVIVKVGEFYYPTDFLVLECVESTQPIIILGRPLLATANGILNFAEGTIRMRFGEKKMNIKIFSNVCNVNANKCELPEMVNHKNKKDCVVTNRVEEKKEDEISKTGRKIRSRKRKRKGKKLEVPDAERELFAVFVQAWRKYDEERDKMMRKECKHPTRPP